MIDSEIVNQIWSSGVTTDEAAKGISLALRSINQIGKTAGLSAHAQAVGAKISEWANGGQPGEQGREFMGRLFPYLGEVDWGDRKQEYWCQRCGDYTRSGVVVAEGWRWIVCKECLYSTKLREDIDPF